MDIALAGELVIKEGYIVNRETSYDANRHAVKVDGYSKAGLATEGSVDVGVGQYRGYPVDAIANDVLKSHGLKFRIDGDHDGAKVKFPNVSQREPNKLTIARKDRLDRSNVYISPSDRDG